jgi:hypothetical protein
MFFGRNSNPWLGNQQTMQPLAQQQRQPTGVMPMNQQQPMTSPPPVTWPGATSDGAFATNLGNLYAQQMPNQQVPGTILPPAAQPGGQPAQPPVATPPIIQQGRGGPFGGFFNRHHADFGQMFGGGGLQQMFPQLFARLQQKMPFQQPNFSQYMTQQPQVAPPSGNGIG